MADEDAPEVRLARDEETVTLWRPTGPAELELVAATGWRQWPPRLPEQPIFYPVCTEEYATRIAKEWNAPASGLGHVTKFRIRRAFLAAYEEHEAGGRALREYWIPAEDLSALNANLVGLIELVATYGPRSLIRRSRARTEPERCQSQLR